MALRIRAVANGYESPCGVMSFLLRVSVITWVALRIPMRGYEIVGGSLVVFFASGYESPCGVMSYRSWVIARNALALRIPMRGYEQYKILSN